MFVNARKQISTSLIKFKGCKLVARCDVMPKVKDRREWVETLRAKWGREREGWCRERRRGNCVTLL